MRNHFLGTKIYEKRLRILFMRNLFSISLVIFFEELSQEFDVFVGHLGDGVGVGAVEVDEPGLWDYFCGLGLDGLQVALAEPAVDGVISVACGGDDLRYGECIGDVFEFLFEPRAEG